VYTKKKARIQRKSRKKKRGEKIKTQRKKTIEKKAE
jgi:hypothetical protein